jgi:mannitol-1-phosphate 5-dehydrogenase
VVLGHVVGAIDELAHVVARHFGFTYAETREYGLELCPRGAIAALRDRILRVVRDPLRKLSREERFVAPAVLALADGTPCRELTLAMAAVLRYSHADDPQSLTMQKQIADQGIRGALPGIVGLPPAHPLIDAVAREYLTLEPSSHKC